MDSIAQRLKAYIEQHLFDPGDSGCETVLDQLFQAYQESHESDPPEIRDGFKNLAELLKNLPVRDNDAVFNLYCVSVNSRLIKEHTGLPQMVGRRYKINICLLQMHCPRTHPRHYLWHTGMLRPSSRNR